MVLISVLEEIPYLSRFVKQERYSPLLLANVRNEFEIDQLKRTGKRM
jgi:hypothetical protein